MVYVVRPRQYVLEFDGDWRDLTEANIVTLGLSIEEADALDPVLTQVPAGLFVTQEAAELRDKLYEEFLNRLVSWELVDAEGKSIPKTVKGMHSLPHGMPTAIIQTWVNRVVGILPKSEEPSKNGETTETLSIPMTSMESAESL